MVTPLTNDIQLYRLSDIFLGKKELRGWVKSILVTRGSSRSINKFHRVLEADTVPLWEALYFKNLVTVHVKTH